MNKSLLFALALASVGMSRLTAAPAPVEELSRYNLVWNSPSPNAAGSMPIGNGEVGLNVWVEPNGDLLFYISRTDAWSECNRLLKLGRVRIHLTPNPFATGQPFRQELKLSDGQIVISNGDMTLRVFVDADAPVIYVSGQGKTPRTVTATFETWRNEQRVLTGQELASSWTMQAAPPPIKVSESADVVTNSPAHATLVYHRNESSVVPLTLKHQGLDAIAGTVRDPLLHRTFGARMSGKGFVIAGANAINTTGLVTAFDISIATQAAQTATVAEWEKQLPKPAKAGAAMARTAKWWKEFWNRSWIFVSEQPSATNGAGAAPSRVTQAYILQRWMTACAGRGNYPIKFNGSIFTVDPKFAGGPDFNADWRKWGDCFWWQNTRLPYFAMIARGDFDEVRTLFRFYRSVLPLCEARAKLYHGVEGAYFPETMTIFGTYANRDYGWDRRGHQPNEVLCPWWQYAWQQGLELTALMLDYYEHTGDLDFLTQELVPMANAGLRYYDTRFPRDANGKLVISPTQSAETYWTGVTNDTPSVAGLNDVCDRLLKLPASNADHAFWLRMKTAAPLLPVRDGRILPAERFNPQRSNVENPELYALWPFRLCGAGSTNHALAVETFIKRVEKASSGWQYDGQCAAIAGLADDAGEILLRKVHNSNRNFRFPAMWGPNYDWLPDQDHGANIMLTLQDMLLQASGEKIYVLPAWPNDWDVNFKLHAPKNTTVECIYREGKLTELKVTPAARRKDVQFMVPQKLLPKAGSPPSTNM
jgi:hypothetical protein